MTYIWHVDVFKGRVKLLSKKHGLTFFCAIVNSAILFRLADGILEGCFAEVELFVRKVEADCRVPRNDGTNVGGRAFVGSYCITVGPNFSYCEQSTGFDDTLFGSCAITGS